MGYLSIYYTTMLFGIAVQGLAFPEPRPTDKVIIPFDAQSPIPTAAPGLHEFLRRQNADVTTLNIISGTDNTCGYFDGRPGAALTCGATTASCVWVLSSAQVPGFVGCCAGPNNCNFAFDCMDNKDAADTSLCGAACQMDIYTLKCTETSLPYCNTAKWFGGISQYFCGSLAVSSPQPIFTTYLGQEGRTMITTSSILSETSSISLRPTTRSSTSKSSSSSSEPSPSSTVPNPPPTSSAPPPQESSSTPIGPIVGGAVGGVAVIGLIILGIVLIMRKKPPAPPPASTPGPGPDPSPPVMFAATPMGGSPPPQHPADIKYGQEPMAQAYGAVPPQNNTQGYQQPQYSPQSGQGYFAVAQQPHQQSSTDQNRISIAPPASPVSSVTSQQQQQQGVTYQHLSQQSFASTQPGAQPFQPGTTAAGYQHAPPPDVYEAGGYAVGGPTDLNADHRGQIHQLQ